ncbi:MAG: hypothetical protein ACYS67_15690 [Planctomycetota bacterium]
MRKRNKIIIYTVIGIPLICIIFYPLLMCVAVMYGFYLQTRDVPQRQVLLLYETDHKALLEACRKVLKEAREGKWEYRQYPIRYIPDPNTDKLPEPILRLNPTYIWIGKDSMMIEMLGGLAHFGVTAFSEESEFEGLEGKKLLDGLWYYSDGYHEVPDYDKVVESWRPKSKEKEKNTPTQDDSK